MKQKGNLVDQVVEEVNATQILASTDNVAPSLYVVWL